MSIFKIYLTALLISVLSGLMAAQGSILLAILLSALVLSPLVFAISTTTLIASSLAIGFIFSGLIQYFGKISQIHWVVAGLFLAMVIRVPFELLSPRPTERNYILNITSVSLIAFCAISIISTLVNKSPFFQAFIGFKHYIFPLSLAAVFCCSEITTNFLLSVWRWIPRLLVLQLPIVFFQYLFFASRRNIELSSQGISWDAIVGTFGGNPDGGGASGALALFLCFGIVATLALNKEKIITKSLTWSAVLSALIVIAVAEVKVVIIFLPVAALAYYRNRVFSSAATAIGWILGNSLFIVGLLYLYASIHWSSAGLHLDSFDKIFEYVFKTESNVEFRNRLTGELSRSAALVVWWTENISRGDYFHALLGYGPAASKISASFGYGEAARHYQFQLNTSALSAMLWDLGLTGTLLFLLALASSVITSFKTANKLRSTNSSLTAIYEGCGVGAVLLAIDLPYNLDVMNNPGIQMMWATIFGIVLLRTKLLQKTHTRQTESVFPNRLSHA